MSSSHVEMLKAQSFAGSVSTWPRPVPIRIKPAKPDDLFVMTLGDVKTPLADGVFDPERDLVTLSNGRTINNYYKDKLGVDQFAPIDKTQFAVPPSGWCSWYYYYQELDSDDVLANARWAAEHLKDYGLHYVQIDDGWQGVGHGLGENRDWTTIDERFRKLGMDGLAAEIRKLGFEAGIWLAPHGQSNEQVARESGAFMFKPDGSTAADTWEGTYLLDPTKPEALAYLRDLFTRLHKWGYTYFKIDGQPIVLDQYAKQAQFMKGLEGHPTTLPADRVTELYRPTLRAIRDGIGSKSYLLGCWGIPLPGVGIMNGSRTGGDIVQGWEGFLVAFDTVMRWNFLHNVAWYCDPDVCMVRPPLSDGAARSWATLQGLTGEALLTSDRLPDLPASRVELLKRIYPAVDIRPLDLFPVEGERKPIWVLEVSQELPQAARVRKDKANGVIRRSYEVVALFNVDEHASTDFYLSWKKLGLDPDAQYHVYDFWQQTYLGAWERGVFIDAPPQDVRVITLVRAEAAPVLVSTSRHITQGWVDLLSLDSAGGDAPVLTGASHVISDDPYTLTVGLPRSAPAFRLDHVELFDPRTNKPLELPVAKVAAQGYATATITSDRTRDIGWRLHFAPSQPYVFPVHAPKKVEARVLESGDVELTWPTEYFAKAGYQVLLDGELLGVAFSPRAVLRGLEPSSKHKVAVRSVWSDGSIGSGLAEADFTTSARNGEAQEPK